jgi:hypothetical protein
MMLRAAFVTLPVHAGRAAVVDLHPIGADVAHARFGIARDTSGSVMNGPPSSGHVLQIGSSSSPPSILTTS